MTMSPARAARLAYEPLPAVQREALASKEVRRSLHALLRRRLPAQEIEDIAQTVLCDAMSAERIPSDPEELRRWLVGIARHKIADYHRRTARTRPAADLDGGTTAPSFDERVLLERLLSEPRTRRDAATLEWLVREHDGERLQDIATNEGLPPTAVRQRVSRLRRALRSRWAPALLFALTVGAGALARRTFVETSIMPEPAASTVTRDEAPLRFAAFEGEWALESFRPGRELTPKEQRIVDLARNALVRVEAGRVELKGGAFERRWDARLEGTRVVLTEANGQALTLDVALDGGRLVLRRGGTTITLRRPTY